MNASPDTARLLDHAGQLLQAGDAQGAHAALLAFKHAGGTLEPRGAWMLAQACRRIDDAAGEVAALHEVLAHNARDMGALLAMGDAFSRQQDDRAATSWFRLALAQAAVGSVPQQLVPLLRNAEAYCAAAQSRFAEHLSSEINAAGNMMRGSPALAQAIDILTGKAELFLQQPSMFYYPGLPQRAFYERDEFAWVAGFEAQCAAMRDEFLALIDHDAPFSPYVERTQTRPAPNNPLLEDESWGAAYLWRGGALTHAAEQTPATIAALAQVPMPTIKARSPMALYSRLRPGTHIQPHHGLLNTRLICHLPLVAPEGCALRVGATTREWRFGEMLIFDDSIEHEAWNRGASDRTVLLFEIWRPEIPEGDRIALAHLFEAIDRVDPGMGQEQV